MSTLKDYKSHTGLMSKSKDGLVLFNYDRETQYSFSWDEVSLNARGIIFEDSTGDIVARPYPKFFNYGEGDSSKLPESFRPNYTGKFRVMEKLDGSLGICYFYKGEWYVSTRGSFESEQALWATAWIRDNIITDRMNPDNTYMFEIIYPENRIVIDYGGLKSLVLHGVINKNTGEEMWTEELLEEADYIGCLVAKFYTFSSITEVQDLCKTLPGNKEGFVITFRNGFKMKIKGDEYCKLHKIVSNISETSFWKMWDLKIGGIPKDFLTSLPEEFRAESDAIISKIENLHCILDTKIIYWVSICPHKFSDDEKENKKLRYFWLQDNVLDKKLISPVLMLLNGNGSVNEWIHKEVRSLLKKENKDE